MARRATLTEFTKPEPVLVVLPDGKLRGQTLRLSPPALRQLKLLAIDRGVAQHALLIEAVNDLFQKHGKPPIA